MVDDSTSQWAGLMRAGMARHGAFHLRLCEQFNVSPLTVRNRANREEWDRPYRGVVCLPGSADSWWRRASSRLEAVGSDAALTGMAAAYAHSMIRPEPDTTEIIRADGKYRPTLPLVVVRTSRNLRADDIEVVNGLRCTNRYRTMRDLAWVRPTADLRAVAIDALRDELLEYARLEEEVEQMPPGLARKRMEHVLADLSRVRTESPFAYDVLETLRTLGFDVVGEFPWLCPDGRVIHHDGAFPASWVSIECDGRGKYQQWGSFTTDRIRWTQTSGPWRTVWIDWKRWHSDQAGVLGDIVRALAEADPSAAPAQRADCRCRRCREWASRNPS
jgi:hypothetical protein